MKNLSEAAKLRISTDPIVRSERMADLARLKASRLTQDQRKAHSLRMVEAKRQKRLRSLT